MLDQVTQSLDQIIQQTQIHLPVLGLMLLVVWGLFFISHFISRRLLYLGIVPRSLYHLPGIFFSPFLHADFNHVFFNSIPLVVLSNFILLQGLAYFIYVSLSIIFISGMAIWCFARPGLHVGASGLITGYWGFLVANLFQHDLMTTLILGFVSIYYFGGIFLGVFSFKKGVSWEGHLFGLLAGILTAYLFAQNGLT